MLGPPGQNQYTAHESCKPMPWVRYEWSRHSALHLDCWCDFSWYWHRCPLPCSKPLRALLPRGPPTYDTFCYSFDAPSHCLSQFLVQVTVHPHPELKRCPQHRTSFSLMFKASTTNFLYPHSWGMLLLKTHKVLLSFSSFHKSSSTKIPRRH